MFIAKALLIFSIISSTLLVAQDGEILNSQEIVMIEKGILAEALKSKDYDTISSMGYSFYVTALKNPKGKDSKALENRAKELLEICHRGNYITASLFLVKSYLKRDPVYAREIAKESINTNRDNDAMHLNDFYRSLVMLYVSSVLDYKTEDKKEVNFALEALEELRLEDSKTLFYKAFLFNALELYDVADEYLNAACHSSTPGSTIRRFCENSDSIEQIDPLEKRVINPDCKKDIGKRCK